VRLGGTRKLCNPLLYAFALVTKSVVRTTNDTAFASLGLYWRIFVADGWAKPKVTHVAHEPVARGTVLCVVCPGGRERGGETISA
jgi:argonaute-like protein implicated in RNA metabolism and viral defense